MIRRLSVLSLFVTLFFDSGFTQSISADTLFVFQARRNEEARYDKDMVSQARLYNGTAYREYHQLKEEHPYLIEDWSDGSIVYDGESFHAIPILYDISEDKVIIEHYTSREKIQLIDSKISSFTLETRRFVHLMNSQVREGYYELAYNGTTKLYIKYIKSFQSSISASTVVHEFEEKFLYYIFKDNTYYPVRNRKNMLMVFQDRKEELSSFIGKNHLRFKMEKGKDFASVTEYYDSLSKP